MPKHRVFISYSSRDRQEAFAIKELLEANDAKVWLDYFDIRTASQLRKELRGRVREADIFCLLLSPSAVESRWVDEEIDNALAAAGKRLRILPLILRPCRIPDKLDKLVGIDASDGLDLEPVRLRIVRAICGEAAVADQILLDAGKRQLIADDEIRLRAGQELPAVNASLGKFSADPFRRIELVIHTETLPENPEIVLELKLTLDTLFHGAMSFFIAQYREGKTWPADFHFEEPEHTEFFLQDRPRLDVHLRWFDRDIRLTPHVDGTDLKTLPATFSMEFDGAEFKPTGDLNLPQVFEIPSLETLTKSGSHFELIAHDPGTKTASRVGPETDIDMELTGGANEEHAVLYASRADREQRIIAASEFLREVPGEIRRTAVLRRYKGRPPLADRRGEILDALEKGQFASDDVRRLAARYRFGEAVYARFKTRHRDAYKMFQEAAELLQPLVLEQKPSLEDASLMYRACLALVEIWLRQESYPQASQLADTLGAIAQKILAADPSDYDYRGMWGDAVLRNAHIHAKLGETERAAEELNEHVRTVTSLYEDIRSKARLAAMLTALTNALRLAREWGISNAAAVDDWMSRLRAMAGDRIATELTRPEPKAGLPAWLTPSEVEGWPVKRIKSSALRYALALPERWSSEPSVRGTSREIEHVYRGPRATEWLIVSFMDKANAHSDMTNWVDPILALVKFPVITELTPAPELDEWRYAGKLPEIADHLAVDEAHAYLGTAIYRDGEHRVMGRLYLLMARRRNYAWKFALSIETAIVKGMPAAMVTRQDHVRAGAILGHLKVGGKSRAKTAGSGD